METIEWDDFQRVEIRVGTITHAEPNTKARRSAYVLTVDLGDFGVKTSSARVTEHYSSPELIGRQVVCVCNFEVKRVAGVRSEVLVLGAYDRDAKVVLTGLDHPVPNGARIC